MKPILFFVLFSLSACGIKTEYIPIAITPPLLYQFEIPRPFATEMGQCFDAYAYEKFMRSVKGYEEQVKIYNEWATEVRNTPSVTE